MPWSPATGTMLKPFDQKEFSCAPFSGFSSADFWDSTPQMLLPSGVSRRFQALQCCVANTVKLAALVLLRETGLCVPAALPSLPSYWFKFSLGKRPKANYRLWAATGRSTAPIQGGAGFLMGTEFSQCSRSVSRMLTGAQLLPLNVLGALGREMACRVTEISL